MGRLIEHKYPIGKLTGRLWKLIKEDTIVWGEPTEEEKKALRLQRKKLFQDSAIPWIMNDLGSILGFYDDIQDIVSFATWNKRLVFPSAAKRQWDAEKGEWDYDRDKRRMPIGECMRGLKAEGRSGAAALALCMCPLGLKRRKRAMARVGAWDLALLGPLATMMLRMFPGTAPFMWALLAGQVSASLFGYGIKLGPMIGAAMELFFRGAGAVGLPFDRSHNKWYQLKTARAMQWIEKGYGTLDKVSAEDRLTVISGTYLMTRDADHLPEFVVKPKDYPTFDDLWDDPFGAFGNALTVAGSLVPNIAAYMANDFINPIAQSLLGLASGDEEDIGPIRVINPHLHSALRVTHQFRCPGRDVCQEAIEDAIALEDWASGEGIGVHHERNWYKLNEIMVQWLHKRQRDRLDPPDRGIFRDVDE